MRIMSPLITQSTGLFTFLVVLSSVSSVQGIGRDEIRLVGGSNWTEGRVEIRINNEWGTVCHDYWSPNDAKVACRQLGLGSAISVLSNAHYGSGSGPIWLDNLHCTGSEASLTECLHRGVGSHNCRHSQDAGVVCSLKEGRSWVEDILALHDAPIVRSVTSNSLSITWSAWRHGYYDGEGPVRGYKIYHKMQGERYFAPSFPYLITRTYATISDLTKDTDYEIAVTALGLGGEGSMSPYLHKRTYCQEPSEAPTLLISWTRQTSITLSWQLPSEETWGCRRGSRAELVIEYRAEGEIGTYASFSPYDETGTLYSLMACTNYDITGFIQNKDQLVGPSPAATSVRTNPKLPEAVSNLKCTLTSATEISITWSVPTTSCPPDHYFIRYSLLQRRACPRPESTDTQHKTIINPTSNKFILTGLEAHSTYHISFIAANGAGEGGVVEQTIFTQTPPDVTGLRHNTSITHPTSIGFIWDALTCRNTGGIFGYYFARIYENGVTGISSAYRKPPTARKYIDYIDQPSVAFDDLEPCTMYELLVSASINTTTRGARHPMYLSGDASRASGLTRLILSNVSVNASSSRDSSMVVRWSLPPRCSVSYYYMEYQLIRYLACQGDPIPEDNVSRLNVTNSNNILSGLEPFSLYNVSITAVVNGTGNTPVVATGPTSESAPAALPSVSYTAEADTLNFTWDALPCDRQHGELHGYEYNLYDNLTKSIVGSPNETTGVTRLSIGGLKACSDYRFQVRVVLQSGHRSDWTTIMARTNTLVPEEPHITDVVSYRDESGTTGLTVNWAAPNSTSNPCQPTNYEIKYLFLQENVCVGTRGSTTTSAGVVNASTMTFDIPDLLPNSKYSVFVRGNNSAGYGLNDSLKQTTSYAPPSGGPTNVKASTVKKRTLKFTWEKPPCSQRHGPITGYDLVLYDTKLGNEVDRRNVSSASAREASFEGLIPYYNYSVSIRARNDDLYGKYGPNVTQQTNEATQPDAPINVSVLSSDRESLTVEWQSPNPPEAHIVGYYINYWETVLQDAGSGDRKIVSIPCTSDLCTNIGDRLSHTIMGLNADTNYSIRVYAESRLGISPPSIPTVTVITAGGHFILLPAVGGVSFSLVLLIVVVAIISIRRRRNMHHTLTNGLVQDQRPRKIKGLDDSHDSHQYCDHIPMQRVSTPDCGNAPSVVGTYYEEVNTGGNEIVYENEEFNTGVIYESVLDDFPAKEHQPIPISQLMRHVAEKKASTTNGFKQDYEILSVAQLHPWEVANKPENQQKNRYHNILAYDHSRIVLTPLENDPHSDYINASYIDGYNSPKKYIATQGPNTASVEDFWRMVWEHDCDMIIMLTNLVEGEKKKCEKYWPENEMLYGKITVIMTKEEINVHYTVRTFLVKHLTETREVVQFHFTSWPDMGVPQYTTSLMNFIRTAKQHKTNSQGFTIVHCSAGVGRTETFITLDSMLDQAEAEGVIDVFSFVSAMKKNIVKMFQVYDQYLFIFNALLETFTCGDTSIAQDVYLQRYPSLLTPRPETGTTVLQEQFGHLEMFTVTPRDMELAEARSQQNMDKNRYPGKLPTDESRPKLITEVENGTNYINASFLPGYTKKDMFIGTQSPLPNTVVDFWRLVFDYKICTVIMLNGQPLEDENMAQYWPDESQSEVRFGPFIISLINEKRCNEFSTRTLEVRCTASDMSESQIQTVCQLQLHTWPMTCEISSSASSIIELHRRAMNWNNTNGKGAPILVHCKDGEGDTGTFCALSSVIERVHVEKLVDVFQACKTVRATRGGTIASVAQYEFIHSVMKVYLDANDIYQNSWA